ncbi:MAG TPA: DUF1415 domain-containing protein [Caldimonas sp.]|nr:DUF1415 domain-containing protein [Caldimonas sp.]
MSDAALNQTRAWVEHAVIGLRLCPFARAPHVAGQVRYVVSAARDPESLLAELVAEMNGLVDEPPERVETTLVIHPHVLTDFADFNDFLSVADAAIAALGLEGVIQVASFHPDYRFAGSGADDIANATNRSPHPTLQLLREASVERGLAGMARPEAIFEANIATLERLGPAGWAAVQRRWSADGADRVDT